MCGFNFSDCGHFRNQSLDQFLLLGGVLNFGIPLFFYSLGFNHCVSGVMDILVREFQLVGGNRHKKIRGDLDW